MFDAHVKRAPRAVKSAGMTLSLLAVLLLGAAAPHAQEAHRHDAHAAKPGGEAPAQPRIPDVACLDQNGKSLRFHTDIVKGKVVVISFIYTNCTYLCTRIGESVARLQTALGDRVGRDVHLISVSTDPVTDTPEKLKAWAARLKAKDGWTLVTGEKAEMDRLLKVLTGDASGNKTHSPLLLIGNEVKNVWAESYAFENPARLIQQIDRVSGAAAP
ncbi:MAG TPA: SCO family protein [Blastocatellia bacterium]|jgi:protein SCO1/2